MRPLVWVWVRVQWGPGEQAAVMGPTLPLTNYRGPWADSHPTIPRFLLDGVKKCNTCRRST